MANKTFLKSGEARVEFLACYETVDELLMKGYSVSAIYKILRDKGVITMSCRTLQEKINKIGKSPRTAGKCPEPPAPIQAHRPKPPVQSGVRLAELDEAIQEMASKRGNLRKKSGDNRKDVIG